MWGSSSSTSRVARTLMRSPIRRGRHSRRTNSSSQRRSTRPRESGHEARTHNRGGGDSMTIRRLLFVLIATAGLVGANGAWAACPVYQGKYADLADKLRRIPLGGQRVLAETCQLVVPTVGPAFGCRSMAVT